MGSERERFSKTKSVQLEGLTKDRADGRRVRRSRAGGQSSEVGLDAERRYRFRAHVFSVAVPSRVK